MKLFLNDRTITIIVRQLIFMKTIGAVCNSRTNAIVFRTAWVFRVKTLIKCSRTWTISLIPNTTLISLIIIYITFKIKRIWLDIFNFKLFLFYLFFCTFSWSYIIWSLGWNSINTAQENKWPQLTPCQMTPIHPFRRFHLILNIEKVIYVIICHILHQKWGQTVLYCPAEMLIGQGQALLMTMHIWMIRVDLHFPNVHFESLRNQIDRF